MRGRIRKYRSLRVALLVLLIASLGSWGLSEIYSLEVQVRVHTLSIVTDCTTGVIGVAFYYPVDSALTIRCSAIGHEWQERPLYGFEEDAIYFQRALLTGFKFADFGIRRFEVTESEGVISIWLFELPCWAPATLVALALIWVYRSSRRRAAPGAFPVEEAGK